MLSIKLIEELPRSSLNLVCLTLRFDPTGLLLFFKQDLTVGDFDDSVVKLCLVAFCIVADKLLMFDKLRLDRRINSSTRGVGEIDRCFTLLEVNIIFNVTSVIVYVDFSTECIELLLI